MTMIELWRVSYFLVFSLTLAYAFFLRCRAESKYSFSALDFLACLPLLASWFGSQPFLTLVAYQIQVFFLVAHWCRSANRDQTESLTKFALSVFLGNFFILCHWLLTQNSAALIAWPLSAFVDAAAAKFAYEALAAAAAGVGLILLLGLPPLQQGWFDLAETQAPNEQFRTQVQLRVGLTFSVCAYVPYIVSSLSASTLEILACIGLLALAVCRLVGGMQMSVLRTLTYQASSFYLIIWLALGLPSLSSLHGALIFTSAFWLLVWTIIVARLSALSSLLPASIVHLHWDDLELPPRFFSTMRWLQIGDCLQGAMAVFFAYKNQSYAMLSAIIFYMLCSISTLLDKNAFRRRSA